GGGRALASWRAPRRHSDHAREGVEAPARERREGLNEELLALAADLQQRGEAFALATVVRCEAPTSAKPGAKVLIREDGSVRGWVGGACAEPVVVREALSALRDGRPRLIGLYGEGARTPGRTEGMLEYGITCHSGGTLEIYVEPYLPKPQLVLVGHGPVIESLAALGGVAGFAVSTLPEDAQTTQLAPLRRPRPPAPRPRRRRRRPGSRNRRRFRQFGRKPAARRGDLRAGEAARHPARPNRPTQGAGRPRHRCGHPRRDRRERPRRDHPASPQREGAGRGGGAGARGRGR